MCPPIHTIRNTIMRNNARLILSVCLLLLVSVTAGASNEPVQLTLVYKQGQPVNFEFSKKPVLTFTATEVIITGLSTSLTTSFADLEGILFSQGEVKTYVPSKGTTAGGTQTFTVQAAQRPPLPVPELPKISIANAVVEFPASQYPYYGFGWKPICQVFLDGQQLKSGVDYTVDYNNNVNPGTATVTVTGIGGYSGTVLGSFVIYLRRSVAVSINDVAIEPAIGTVTNCAAPATFSSDYGTVEVDNVYALPGQTVHFTVTPTTPYVSDKAHITPNVTGEDPAELGQVRTYEYTLPTTDNASVQLNATFWENVVDGVEIRPATSLPAVMTIYTTGGQFVASETIASDGELKVRLNRLPAGVYIIYVNNHSFKVQKK